VEYRHDGPPFDAAPLTVLPRRCLPLLASGEREGVRGVA
jgi:hypothetical protein